ncbi:MAG: GIY-YIG nuclease family protein [Parcubacteria group bacterium]|nr:GIY-YIG nuclease family protein [Parcubacteria group bacterium]
MGQEKFYAYVLLSMKDKKLYIGQTNNLKRRLQQHARGEVTSTKKRRPLQLIHYEYFINKGDAEAREIFLKSGYGHDQLKNILKRTLSE